MTTRLKNLAEFAKLITKFAPQDINGAAQGGNYNLISMRNYQSAAVILWVGAHSGSAVAVTLQQAKNVEGNGAKALSFTQYYSNAYLTSPEEESDQWVEQTASSDTFNIAANTAYVIPVRPAMLDVTNDFDCIRLHLAAADASTIVAATIMLWGGPAGITGDIDHIPSAAINRMQN